MQIEPLTIQQAIINRQDYEDYQCQICYSIALNPCQCIGPCRKRFCTKCVSDWKIQKDFCPMKCSSPYYVKMINPPNINFKCPYDSSKCHKTLDSIKKFQEHYEQCQQISQNQKWLKQIKRDSKCFKEHQLQFFLGTYQEMCQSQCTSCKEVKLCRSICRKCNQLFCVYCRPPVCCQECCPLGHSFKFQKTAQIGYICDLCGISASITKSGIYDDLECNFGLCELCYNSLPEKIEKKKQLKNPFCCNKNHDLILQLPQNQKKKCQNCQHTKFCPKNCPKCKQDYCLSCKMGIIQSGEKCKLGHKLELITEVKIEDQKNLNCIKCQKQIKQYFYIDKLCEFILCMDCYQYEQKIIELKNRFVEQMHCKRGHELKYYSQKENYNYLCCNCKQTKVIRLFCDYCSQGQRTYCCECRRLKDITKCYFGHDLQDFKSQQQSNCQLCMNQTNQFKKCFKCNYYLCNSCYLKNNEKQIQQENMNQLHNNNQIVQQQKQIN